VEKLVCVGIGVVVFKDGKILLGFRKKSHGSESWSLPGGKLEFGESFEQCAEREVLEETGLQIKNLQTLCVHNDFFEKEQKHFATLGMTADWVEGELRAKEPEKFNPIEWFSLDALPQPLFMPSRKVIEFLKANRA